MANLRQRKVAQDEIKRRESRDENLASKQDFRWSTFFKLCMLVFIVLPSSCLLVFLMLTDSPIDPVASSVPEAPRLEGPLAPNDILVAQSERMFEGKLKGPESLAIKSGYLYTGTADRNIFQLDVNGETTSTIAVLGPSTCGQGVDEERCGRPLGMKFDRDGNLIVLDAYFGMYKINITSREVFQLLASKEKKFDGRECKCLNGLDIADDGTIYFSDSSHFGRKDFILNTLESRPHGRLLKYNPDENTVQVVVKNLHFPNGVCLSEDNSYLLVAETPRYRIMKYHLTSPKKGQLETFVENLPGIPDDIRKSSSGGYWVALGTCRDADRFNLMDKIQPYPWIKKQFAKVASRVIRFIVPRCGLVIELDKEGNILRSLHDRKGEKLFYISTAEEDDGYLYTGSVMNSFIGRVNLSTKPTSI